jgi:hypothetical protein
MPSLSHGRSGCKVLMFRILLVLGLILGAATQNIQPRGRRHVSHGWQSKFVQYTKRDVPAKRGPPGDDDKVPLVITNRCESTMWPGLATQSGVGPGTGGFELAPGKSKKLWVASNWQGRIWGRTNCTVNGESCACETGDCFAKLDCEFSVSTITMSLKSCTYTQLGGCSSYACRI